jgi:anti-anti-sigma regulatory factor
VDSAGVKCLLDRHQSCATLGVKSLEIAPSREVARVLDLVRFREATETRVSPPTPSTSATDESETGMVADKTGGD